MNTYHFSNPPRTRLFFRASCGRSGRIILLASICWMSAFAASSQAFQKLYTNPDSAFFLAYDLCSDVTQGFFITGAVQVTRPQTFVMKTSLTGTPVWGKILTASEPFFYYTTGESISRTSDNGLILTCAKIGGAQESGGVLIKMTSAGNIQWSKFAACLWHSNQVCADGNSVYYASEGKNVAKVYLTKISNSGLPTWEQWLEAGDMDSYTVESLVPCANGDLAMALLVTKDDGPQAGQNQTILLRIDPAGVVQQAALFPVAHLAALVPLSDGRIAFRCSASNGSWTGMGMMDSQFNWLWFKKIRFGLTPFLSNIVGQELAVSGDETLITGIFYTPGGEKTALSFDINGNLLQEELYATNTLAQAAAAAPAKGYVRVAGARTTSFSLTRSYDDGTAFVSCFFPKPCGLQVEDTVLTAQPVGWQTSAANCIQNESAVSENLPVATTDYCIDIGTTVNADFRMNDTVICTGGTIDFTRNSGAFEPVFGTSVWSFEGGNPSSSTNAIVQDVRYNQPGMYQVRHIYTIAGCRDTSYLTVTVLASVSVNLGPDTTLCSGGNVQISAGNQTGASYQWNTGESGSGISVTQSGTYTVTVTLGGCTATDARQVQILSKDYVALGPDTAVCNGGSIILKAPDAAAGYPLLWSTGETGPYISVASPGLYSLELSSGICFLADTILIDPKNCNGCQVYAPNVFAPDGGIAGNVFRLMPGCTLVSGKWQIYDRWGSLLFESSDLTQGWDGRMNGKILPAGVYIFTAELDLAEPQKPVERRKITGSVTLVR